MELQTDKCFLAFHLHKKKKLSVFCRKNVRKFSFDKVFIKLVADHSLFPSTIIKDFTSFGVFF